MADKLKVQTSIIIQAPVNKVWQALTDPSIIKEYLFGTNTVTDWKKGSAITWSGMYEGKSYQDKGTIIEIVPEKKITYYSLQSIVRERRQTRKLSQCDLRIGAQESAYSSCIDTG